MYPPPGLICASWQCEGLSFTLGKFAISRQFHTQFTCDCFHGKKKSLTEFCPLFYIFHKNTNSSFSPLHVFYTPHSGTTHQIGSFSNDDGDGNQDVKKAIALSRFFVHFFTVLARLRSENASLQVLWRT